MRNLTIAIAGGDRLPARLIAGHDLVGVVLAHGAGAGQDHPWMVTIRDGLASVAGATVLTFDYPYMAAGRRAPDRPGRLLDAHAAAVARLREVCGSVVLAGKSMGARIGSHLAGDRGEDVAGLVHYGYPLVAPGKSEPRDVAHLANVAAPQLFLAGSRDRLCPIELIRPVVAALPSAELVVVEGGDHSFRVAASSGTTPEAVLAGLVQHTADWLGRAGLR